MLVVSFQEYETADSGVSEQSSSTCGGLTSLERKRKRKLSMLSAVSAPEHPVNRASSAQDHPSDPMQRRHVSFPQIDATSELRKPLSKTFAGLGKCLHEGNFGVFGVDYNTSSRKLIGRSMLLGGQFHA